MWTGPGRPVRASLKALGRNFARSLDGVRLEAPLRQITLAMLGKSL